MRDSEIVQAPVVARFIGCDQRDFFTGDGYGRWLRSLRFSPRMWTPLARVFVLLFSAKENLVNLDLAHELFPFGILHGRAQSHALIPSRVIVVQMFRSVHHPVKLQSTDALFRGQHQIADFEPRPERAFRVLEYRVRDHREAIAVRLVARQNLASLFVRAFFAALSTLY